MIKQVYQQVKELISKEIDQSVPGQYIKSEMQFADAFNVSRLTVRKAVKELVEEGIIERIPGKGLMIATGENKIHLRDLLLLLHFHMDDGFYYNILMGSVNSANKAGMGYKVFDLCNYSTIEEASDIDLTKYSGAIIHANDSKWYYNILKYMDKNKFPYVLVDNKLENYRCNYVIADDYKGGYLQGTYLAENGHKQILYLSVLNTPERIVHTAKERENGFRQALLDYGIQLPNEYFLHLKQDDEVEEALSKIEIPYSAICAYSDIPAIAAYQFVVNKGLRVPEDVSIMGYSNFKSAALLPVPLSTIAMPSYEMGIRATEIIIDRALGNSSALNEVVLEVELVERKSVKNMEL